MDTYFNLNRISYLLRADWIEHKKNLLLSLGGVSLVWIALLYFKGLDSMGTQLHDNTGIQLQKTFFFIGGLITFIYYCRFISKKIHQPKGLYYTLPASNQEKYFTLLFEGLLFFLAFAAIFWLGLFLFKLFSPAFSLISLSELYHGIISIGLLLFVSSIIVLSHIAFRKHAVLICFTGIAVYVLLFVYVSMKVLSVNTVGFHPFIKSSFANEAVGFMKLVCTPTLLVATIVVLYIGYLKLKEKELR
jgi:hypothetical protein